MSKQHPARGDRVSRAGLKEAIGAAFVVAQGVGIPDLAECESIANEAVRWSRTRFNSSRGVPFIDFVCIMAKKFAIRHLSKQLKQPLVLELVEEVVSNRRSDQIEQVIWVVSLEQALPLIIEALPKLKDRRLMRAFVLELAEGCPPKEIAQLLRIEVEVVYGLHDKLKSLSEKVGIR